ncbi:uncharacterized protein LOC103961444 isoform X2 [Pyrus x bretschneideri]|uniref:uncharacterized protein LOC103961444 isoform X2 n=1 Tax=Pyrus x bretschneideri TaxID=225117 RepID=UPI00202FB65E|nr:uncharacterized protein LOC103961444 isoform X2 [Pyrus x bretschneideri]
MDSKDENMELINEAIKRLLEERKNSKSSAGEGVSQGGGDDDDGDKDEDRLLLHRLLSQLESLKGNGELRNSETSTKTEEETSSKDGELKPENESCGKADGGGAEIDTEKIVREVNKVKKQNSITHWLLSIMIVLTVAWQASEATFLWKLNEGFRHPFRCIGGMLTGNGKDSEERHRVQPENVIITPELPSAIGITSKI